MVRQLVEIFGYAAEDYSELARTFWALKACPFVGRSCTKFDHTKTICYGTCSVTNSDREVVICPIRLYENDYRAIRQVCQDAYGNIPMLLFDDFLKVKPAESDCVVALGQNSGREVKLAKMSMDWVLARISAGKLVDYIGLEVQSIDITGNYRDAWYGARDMAKTIPSSGHGLNWANVHKRLIPQLIRKGLVYSRSSLVSKGLYFIVPEAVFEKFEEIIGSDIPKMDHAGSDVISVFTYELGGSVPIGERRELIRRRVIRFKLNDFSNRFIAGASLPTGQSLDNKIRDLLSVK